MISLESWRVCVRRGGRKKKREKEKKVPRIRIRPAGRQVDGSIVKGQTKQRRYIWMQLTGCGVHNSHSHCILPQGG